MNIRFLGAVEGVTGSCHLIEFKDKKILLDCGQFQGKNEEFNERQFEFNPSEIDYLFLSHCHIDHCGRIPLLIKNGFKGTIYCSKPTFDLCQIMLVDSAHIHETEAEWKNRKAKRAGKHLVQPLYTQQDAIDSFKYFKTSLYEQMVDIDDSIVIRFNDAGHILGSSIIEMWFKEDGKTTKLVFSGDLGMNEKPILNDPVKIEKADYVIVESTYGDRQHEVVEQRMEELIDIILKTTRRGGTVVIPSFAVGRTQEIIYELNKYYDSNVKKTGGKEDELRNIPVYIDSPLASKATEIFKLNAQVFDIEARKILMAGDNPLEFYNLHFVQSAEESMKLNFSDEPKIIISASGMCDAGRIKHHLKHNLWRKESSIVFVGYQAEGTLGRRIRDGEKDVKIFGEDIHISAEIYDIEGFSGHADKNGLLEWLKAFKTNPKNVFVVHGEPEAKEAFAQEITSTLGLKCIVPKYLNVYELTDDKLKEQAVSSNAAAANKVNAIKINEVSKTIETSQANPIMEIKIPDKAKEPADEGKVKELITDVKDLKKLCRNALKITEGYLEEESVNVEVLNRINNKIIEIENELLNLTMLSGK